MASKHLSAMCRKKTSQRIAVTSHTLLSGSRLLCRVIDIVHEWNAAQEAQNLRQQTSFETRCVWPKSEARAPRRCDATHRAGTDLHCLVRAPLVTKVVDSGYIPPALVVIVGGRRLMCATR